MCSRITASRANDARCVCEAWVSREAGFRWRHSQEAAHRDQLPRQKQSPRHQHHCHASPSAVSQGGKHEKRKITDAIRWSEGTEEKTKGGRGYVYSRFKEFIKMRSKAINSVWLCFPRLSVALPVQNNSDDLCQFRHDAHRSCHVSMSRSWSQVINILTLTEIKLMNQPRLVLICALFCICLSKSTMSYLQEDAVNLS